MKCDNCGGEMLACSCGTLLVSVCRECGGKAVSAETALELREKYGSLFDRYMFPTERRLSAAEKRREAQERLDMENAAMKYRHDAECRQIRQKFDADYDAWQLEANQLKAVAAERIEQGICPHCGERLSLLGNCPECKKKPDDPIYIAPPPKKPRLPKFTPEALATETVLPDDAEIDIYGTSMFVKLGGISWQVLAVENGKALLLSEKIITARPYSRTCQPTTWESCTLREWLNGEFFNNLGSAKAQIAWTTNITPDNQWHGTKGGFRTEDRVFLLSVEDVLKYFGDSGAAADKANNVCLSDKHNTARKARNLSGAFNWWWLRTPGREEMSAVTVDADGSIYVYGLNADNQFGGVRPAILVHTSIK